MARLRTELSAGDGRLAVRHGADDGVERGQAVGVSGNRDQDDPTTNPTAAELVELDVAERVISTMTKAKPTAAPRENVRITAPATTSGDAVGGQAEQPAALAPGLKQGQRDEHQHDLGVAVLLADRPGQPGDAPPT